VNSKILAAKKMAFLEGAERLRAVVVIQRYVRRALALNAVDDLYDLQTSEMLMRCQRALSDGHTYHIFLFRKTDEDYDGPVPQPSYLIVLRNIADINSDLIDFDLTEESCRKIFKMADSPEPIDDLI
jgi:hypothetical protein